MTNGSTRSSRGPLLAAERVRPRRPLELDLMRTCSGDELRTSATSTAGAGSASRRRAAAAHAPVPPRPLPDGGGRGLSSGVDARSTPAWARCSSARRRGTGEPRGFSLHFLKAARFEKAWRYSVVAGQPPSALWRTSSRPVLRAGARRRRPPRARRRGRRGRRGLGDVCELAGRDEDPEERTPRPGASSATTSRRSG